MSELRWEPLGKKAGLALVAVTLLAELRSFEEGRLLTDAGHQARCFRHQVAKWRPIGSNRRSEAKLTIPWPYRQHWVGSPGCPHMYKEMSDAMHTDRTRDGA